MICFFKSSITCVYNAGGKCNTWKRGNKITSGLKGIQGVECLQLTIQHLITPEHAITASMSIRNNKMIKNRKKLPQDCVQSN